MSFSAEDIKGTVVEHKIRKNEQLIVDPHNGDCFRACVTSLLGMPNTSDLPDGGENWFPKWYKFLMDRGLGLHYEEQAFWRNGYWIASVESLNFSDVTHAIIMHCQEVYHDPSPNKKYPVGENLLGKDIVLGGWYFEIEDFSKFINTQTPTRYRFNREKLLRFFLDFANAKGEQRQTIQYYSELADAIIAADKEIVEVDVNSEGNS